MRRFATFFVGILCLWTATAAAGVELPSVFADHMVLQRGRPIPVWGRAAAGEAIRVEFGVESVATTAGEDGRWSVELPPQEASDQPRTLSVHGSDTRRFEDVLVGEVWVCSGQSNMQWTVASSMNPAEEIAAATEPRIRMFQAEHTLSNEPQFTVEGTWKVSSPETVGEFSAVGYYFGRHLQRELGVPVGLVHTSWGGSRIEPWIARESLLGEPAFASLIETQDRAIAEFRALTPEDIEQAYRQQVAEYGEQATAYWKRVASADPGRSEAWMGVEFDDSAWKTMTVPSLWRDADAELAEFDGMVWYRKEVQIPAVWAGQELVLELGAIDDADETYFNGAEVGNTIQSHQALRRYSVPGDLVRPGRAVITVMALDTGGAGGMTGPKDTMRLSCVLEDGEPIDLSGEWRYQRGADSSHAGDPPAAPARPTEPGREFSSPAAMYNAMVHPLVPYAMRGALWYQGESNAGQAAQYIELLPLLIRCWRERWSDPFPFGIVQLASFYPAAPEEPVQGGWAYLREAQWLTSRTVPGTGLATTSDIGDARDIHPKNKQEVGRRLGLWAMAKVYGQDVVCSGPTYQDVALEGPRAVLHFQDVGGGLVARDGALRGFAVAGEDGEFVWADATIVGDTVVVSAPQVESIRAVRYGWCNNLEHLNLYNAEGLPASPFRTDHP